MRNKCSEDVWSDMYHSWNRRKETGSKGEMSRNIELKNEDIMRRSDTIWMEIEKNWEKCKDEINKGENVK